MGPELMQRFRDQAERFGARLITDEAYDIAAGDRAGRRAQGHDRRRDPRVAHRHPRDGRRAQEARRARRGGARRRRHLLLRHLRRRVLQGSPRSSVGGGDSAMEEAIFLAKFASKVTVVNRRDEFRASKIMLERARAEENIELLTPYVVDAFLEGDGPYERIARLKHTRDGGDSRSRSAVRFIAIGHEPQSAVVAGQVELDENGYVVTEGQLDAHEAARRLRRGRPRRPHLPPGDHRGRLRLPGRPRRRVVPARQPRGPDARGHADGRPRRGPVGLHRFFAGLSLRRNAPPRPEPRGMANSKLAAQPEHGVCPKPSQPALTTADRVRLSLLLAPPRP